MDDRPAGDGHHLLCRRLRAQGGAGFGGAIAGWLLGAYGYVAAVAQVPQVQTASALDGIRLTSSLFASIPFLLGVVCLLFYSINKQREIQSATTPSTRRWARS